MNDATDFCELAFRSTWGLTCLLRTCLIAMPLISIAAFIRSWILHRRREKSYWHSRLILLAALITFTMTTLRALATLQYISHYAASEGLNSVAQAMAWQNISFLSSLLSSGILVTAFCTALAILTPPRYTGA